MKYTKIEKNNYNIHVINNDRFKTITVEINFSTPLAEEVISYNKMLSKLITYSTKNYNTRKKFSIKLEELYGSDFFVDTDRIGQIANFRVGIDFLNPKYTEKTELKNNIEMLFEGIFNPNVENKKFASDSFDLAKDSVLTNIKISDEYPTTYANRKFKNIMFKGTVLEYEARGNEQIIKEITEENLYEYYQNLIENSTINIIIYGDLTSSSEKYLIKILDDKFKNLKINKIQKLSPLFKRSFSSDINEIKETKNISQSELIMGFNIEGIDENQEMYPMILYNNILGMGMNSLLFNKVREEHSLCYSIYSSIYRYGDALSVHAGISKSNYENAVKLIKECLKLMQDKKVIEEELDNAKKELNTRINNYYDSKGMVLEHYFINEFIFEDDIEVQREKINKVTAEEIIEIGKHISLSTIYFLEGVKVASNE